MSIAFFQLRLCDDLVLWVKDSSSPSAVVICDTLVPLLADVTCSDMHDQIKHSLEKASGGAPGTDPYTDTLNFYSLKVCVNASVKYAFAAPTDHICVTLVRLVSHVCHQYETELFVRTRYILTCSIISILVYYFYYDWLLFLTQLLCWWRYFSLISGSYPVHRRSSTPCDMYPPLSIAFLKLYLCFRRGFSRGDFPSCCWLFPDILLILTLLCFGYSTFSVF